ncbi:MAG TPA: hypothetical protein H9774_04460 [Candidatus Desulfovibrio gallistercoris]|nr:hypothetical protein [Candidatus Desulfovibrio gallistercoris]
MQNFACHLIYLCIGLISLKRFAFDRGEARDGGHSAARPKVSGKTTFFPRNDRPYGLKRVAFQTDKALERFAFEKGKTRGGGTAPPGPK